MPFRSIFPPRDKLFSISLRRKPYCGLTSAFTNFRRAVRAAYCCLMSCTELALPAVPTYSLFLLEIHLALSTEGKGKGNYAPELCKPIKRQRFLKETTLNPKALAARAVMKCMTTGDNNNCSNGSLQLPDDLVLSGVRCPLTSQEANGGSGCKPWLGQWNIAGKN